MREAWPMDTEGWVEKLEHYAPAVLELIDSGENPITVNVNMFRCLNDRYGGYKSGLVSVISAAVELASRCDVTIIFAPVN